jgi:hypothetical protein
MNMRLKRADQLLEQMVEGRVYRREQLVVYSKAVDRDLAWLVSEKKVVKAAAGLYYRPKLSRFGPLAASPDEVVRAYLKTDDFLLTSLNYFNGLAVGLTQLTNESLVYNRKRVGRVKLDGMNYYFQRPVNFPKREELNEEYLFVDLLNNYDDLHEPPETERFIKSLRRKAGELRRDELFSAASRYGKARAQRMLRELTACE